MNKRSGLNKLVEQRPKLFIFDSNLRIPTRGSGECEREVALVGRGDVSVLAQRELPGEEEGNQAGEGMSAALKESVQRGQRERSHRVNSCF